LHKNILKVDAAVLSKLGPTALDNTLLFDVQKQNIRAVKLMR